MLFKYFKNSIKIKNFLNFCNLVERLDIGETLHKVNPANP